MPTCIDRFRNRLRNYIERMMEEEIARNQQPPQISEPPKPRSRVRWCMEIFGLIIFNLLFAIFVYPHIYQAELWNKFLVPISLTIFILLCTLSIIIHFLKI